MTSLIGRQREVALLERWAERGGRILTVTGPPGVGKSRLAREVAARQARAVVCDLAPCRAPADVERALQRVLGGVSRARLVRTLATFDGLVVLDRFEHLVEGARGLVAAFAEGPGARFLITSREPLGLMDETVLTLGALDAADALALYAACARRSIDASVAEALVARLDRLPLAIELAASRAPLLTERRLLARLEGGLSAIDTPTATIRQTVLWSIGLLDPDERATLLQCAVFRGAFDGRAAEAIVRAGDTLALLVALERKSLVRRDERAAAQPGIVLYDVVREVARAELAREDPRGEVDARHAAHYVALARAVLEAPDDETLHSLQDSIADLAAAEAYLRARAPNDAATIALALDLAHGGSPPTEGHLALLSAAVEGAAGAGDRSLHVRALHARARAHRLVGAARRATNDLRAALALARTLAEPRREAEVLRLLGVVQRQRVRPVRARALLVRALALYEAAGDAGGSAMVKDDLGVVAHDLGDLAEARASYEHALALARVASDRRFEGIARFHLGTVAHDRDSVALARAHYTDALVILREVGDRRFEGFVLAFMTALALEERALEEAGRLLELAATIDARIGDVDSGALLAGLECALAAARGQIPVAREIFARARAELARRDGDALGRTLEVFASAIRIAEARRAREEGRPAEADAHLEFVRTELAADRPARSIEERFARRVTSRLLEVDVPAVARVASDGAWFDGAAGRVSLARRRSLAALLARLAAEHHMAPGQSVELETLFVAGWPGERLAAASARRRVYVGIDTLRTLGLRSAIIQKDRGYLLDSSVVVVGNEL